MGPGLGCRRRRLRELTPHAACALAPEPDARSRFCSRESSRTPNSQIPFQELFPTGIGSLRIPSTPPARGPGRLRCFRPSQDPSFVSCLCFEFFLQYVVTAAAGCFLHPSSRSLRTDAKRFASYLRSFSRLILQLQKSRPLGPCSVYQCSL